MKVESVGFWGSIARRPARILQLAALLAELTSASDLKAYRLGENVDFDSAADKAERAAVRTHAFPVFRLAAERFFALVGLAGSDLMHKTRAAAAPSLRWRIATCSPRTAGALSNCCPSTSSASITMSIALRGPSASALANAKIRP